MNPVTLRRIGIAGAILTLLVAIDGIYMLVSKYNGGETQNYNLPDGATVLIAAALLLIVTIVAFLLAMRASTSSSAAANQKSIKSEVKPQ
ncbi:MAG TPA: hypothetical protein VKV20_17285 [Ktedonobacteraceae bacterium]|jgi:drug/metabolite transporter (DMT)-like permease|nr:hypothetical protein [Ktedonobacteraceae bacterium]